MNKRIFIDKKNEFSRNSEILSELKNKLSLSSLTDLRKYIVYDFENLSEKEISVIIKKVLYKPITDKLLLTINQNSFKSLAIEYLPLQYDLRSDSAKNIAALILNRDDFKIKAFESYLFNSDINEKDFLKLKNHLINPIEKREKSLNHEKAHSLDRNTNIFIHNKFTNYTLIQLKKFKDENNLSLNINDLEMIREYFHDENRQPNNAEIMFFETYWSDHCRHTTFETEIEKIIYKNKLQNNYIVKSHNLLMSEMKKLYGSSNTLTLMKMAKINAKIGLKEKWLNDLELSDEVNACSIKFKTNRNNEYFLNFKNETHNHPTEIEPFGGASTCLGGAIRDILANRAYPFAGIRISGSGDIFEDYNITLDNKLPQNEISKKSALGFSSYGNQIGMPTSFVKQIYHSSYVAKHLECGAVIGIAPKENVNKKIPQPGDIIVLFGADTGIDGIGGASGSSKKHDITSYSLSAEVQKGNPIIERKIMRLFKENSDFSRLIKKSNDFGAGGASVALGELSDGVEILLDRFKTKSKSISPYEILFSESQERMAAVIDKSNLKKFIKYCSDENLDAYMVGKITDTNRLIAKYNDKEIINIKRWFLNTNGAKQKTSIIVNKFPKTYFKKSFSLKNELNSLNNQIDKGLVEQFDSSIGKTMALSPYGGRFQLTKEETPILKIPLVNDKTDHHYHAVIGTGFPVKIASENPFLGGYYSILESISKIVSKGIEISKIRISLQEYFPKLTSPEKWSLPFLSLLGAFQAMYDFKLAAIGGKDSMSGTYKNIDVTPTLISFGFAHSMLTKKISNTIKKTNSHLYIMTAEKNNNGLINSKEMIEKYNYIQKIINKNRIDSIIVLDENSAAINLIKASLGNMVNFHVNYKNILRSHIGGFIIQSPDELSKLEKIGKTGQSQTIINNRLLSLSDYLFNSLKQMDNAFTSYNKLKFKTDELKPININRNNTVKKEYNPLNKKHCKTLIAVFPGTNCEYDLRDAFKKAGSLTEIFIFKNIDTKKIKESVVEFANKISKCDILAIPGGFSQGDEPDGSGKFIANILCMKEVKQAINKHIENKKLIIGICNGFQALMAANLLPCNYWDAKQNSCLTFNKINRHISTVATTKIISVNSPWLKRFKLNDIQQLPISNGEGNFWINNIDLQNLINNKQIFSIYSNKNSFGSSYDDVNFTGSTYKIEGIVSKDGLILGRMGHPERVDKDLFTNVINNHDCLEMFKAGVEYIKG